MLLSKPTKTKQPKEANDLEGKRTDITSLYCLLKHFMVHELALKTERALSSEIQYMYVCICIYIYMCVCLCVCVSVCVARRSKRY